MVAFAKCVIAETYSDFLLSFSRLYLVLSKEKIPSCAMEVFGTNSMASDIITQVDELAELCQPINFMQDSNFDEKTSLYMNSRYIKDVEAECLKIQAEASTIISSPIECQKLGKYLLRKLGPFCPLWASFCHSRETNALVESHFKYVKHDLLKTINMKPARAIKDLRVDVISKMLNITMSQKFKEKKRQKKLIIEETENFKKRPQPQLTNFEIASQKVPKIDEEKKETGDLHFIITGVQKRFL